MRRDYFKKFGFLSLLVLSTILLISWYYGKIIIAPNQILFNSTGDGLKNYYVPMMQVGSDSYFIFNFFNYPYGEHFFYTDGFPILVLLLKPVALIFPEISSNIPGIINVSMLFSILFCAIFIYLILVRLKLPELLSLIFAIGITSLQPQIFRITGHFSLAFCHIIPLSFWLVLMFLQSDKKIKWTILICIHNIVAILFHPYLGLMSVLSTIPVLFIWGLKNKLYANWKLYFALIFQSAFPLLFYKILIMLTDNVVDRNTLPQGFHENTADFVSVFLPSFGPLAKFFNFDNMQLSHNWEGISYIGMATTFLLVPVLILFLIKIFQKKEIEFRSVFLIGILISSVVFLFLSMGYPFSGKYYDAYQKIPFLREFRALGRFAWVFYYASTIFLAVGLWSLIEKWVKSFRSKYLAIFIMGMIPISFIFESYSLHDKISIEITRNKNCFLEKNISTDVQKTLMSINPSEFQAILPLPYFYVGTELYDVFGTENSQQNSIFVSQRLRLPLLSNYSARSSFDISRKLIRIVSNNVVYKDIVNDFSDKSKPFLIVLSNDELNDYENEIINKSILISKCNSFSLRKISFKDLFSSNQVQFPESYSQYTIKNSWLSLDTSKVVFAENFEDRNSSFSFAGKGSYSGVCKLYHILCEFPDNLLVPDSIYNASFWVYNYDNPHVFAKHNLIAFVNHYDTITKNTSWDYAFYPIKSTLSVGSWSLVDIQFSIPDNHSKYSIVLKGNDSIVDNVYVDNLLVIKKGASTYKELNDTLFLWNNYVQKKSGNPFIYK